MDNRNNIPRDPWEQGYYETGRTRPPKNNRGLIAILLVVIIFLGGMVGTIVIAIFLPMITMIESLSQ